MIFEGESFILERIEGHGRKDFRVPLITTDFTVFHDDE